MKAPTPAASSVSTAVPGTTESGSWRAGLTGRRADRHASRRTSCCPPRRWALSASEVGAVYLGGGRFAPLLGAGRIEERTTGAAARADSMFATRLQPWTAAS